MRRHAVVLAAVLIASGLLGAARASHWPHATYTSPPDGGANVPVSTNFEILWSETMDYATVEASFRFVDLDRAIEYDSSDGGWIHNLGTSMSTFDPAFLLPTGTRFYFQVCAPSGAIGLCVGATSGSGEPLDQNQNDSPDTSPTDDLRVDFTTAGSGPSDTQSPKVTFSVPSDGQTTFPADGDVLLSFSESMDRASVEAALAVTDGTTTRTASEGFVTWTQDGSGRDVLQWDLSTDLVPNRTYSLHVAGTARDVSGNLLDGDGNGSPGGTFTATFTTTLSTPVAPHSPPSLLPVILLGAIAAGVLLVAFLWMRRRRPASSPAFPPPP